ncbi:MAG: Nif3-like dinuclear metal center hexameric protein [Lachnospiraceae bacterium]
MKAKEVIALLQNLAPESWQCKWDNSGLLVGSGKRDVKKIFVTVDVTEEVIEKAISEECDMIVSHHPMIFSGVKRISDEDFDGKKVLKLAENGIVLYAMHTNFDKSDRGMGMAAAERLHLEHRAPLGDIEEKIVDDGYEVTIGVGAKGVLQEPMPLRKFCERLKGVFSIDSLHVFAGSAAMDTMISYVALCPGSGADGIEDAIKAGADVYVTGDIKHHTGLDAAERGLIVIDCGHYQMEWIFIDVVSQYLHEMCSDELEVVEDCYRPAYETI